MELLILNPGGWLWLVNGVVLATTIASFALTFINPITQEDPA